MRNVIDEHGFWSEKQQPWEKTELVVGTPIILNSEAKISSGNFVIGSGGVEVLQFISWKFLCRTES